jgi:hypothetical protein
MRRNKIVGKYIILLLLCFMSISVDAQMKKITKPFTEVRHIDILKKSKPHSTKLAWMLSAALPGLGQVYNGQWWKVPILYGGITGIVYGLNWNSKNYKSYRAAFGDYISYIQQKAEGVEEPTGERRWEDLVPYDVSDYDASDEEWFQTSLKNRRDKYKRDRDMLYLVMAGTYFINIIDALVSAHFYDFDISDDLSMQVRPHVKMNTLAGNNLGVSCSFRF